MYLLYNIFNLIITIRARERRVPSGLPGDGYEKHRVMIVINTLVSVPRELFTNIPHEGVAGGE